MARATRPLAVIAWAALAACPYGAGTAQDAKPAGPKGGAPRTDPYGDALPPGTVARLGTTRFRLLSPPWALACSPDGRWLATHEGGVIYLLDAATGRRVRELRGHKGTILCLAYSPDGRTLASGDTEHSFRVWDASTGRELRRFQGEPAKRPTGYSPFAHVLFTPDGKGLVTQGVDNLVRLWDIATGREVRRFTAYQDLVWTVAVARDGKTLAALVTPPGIDPEEGPDELRVWEVATGKQVRRWPAPAALSIHAFSPDLDVLATRRARRPPYGLTLWDVATGKAGRTLPEDPAAATYSADGKTLVTCANSLSLWDVATGKPLRHAKVPRSHPFSRVALLPDGRTLVVWGTRQLIEFYDTLTGKGVRRFDGHDWGINALAFSPDGKSLASGSAEEVRLWDLSGKRQVRRLELDQSRGWPEWAADLAFFPDGKRLLAGGGNQGVQVWDVSGGPKPRRPAPGVRGRLALTGDGKAAVTWQNGIGRRSLTVWDPDSWKPVREWELGPKYVGALALSPDSRWADVCLTGDGQLAVLRWDLATGRILPARGKHANHPNALAHSPDGRLLAAVEWHEKLRLWETATGALRAEADLAQNVTSLAFCPGGRFLAVANHGGYRRASKDGRTGNKDPGAVRLLEVSTGKEVHRFAGHRGGVACLAFSPEGRLLATGGHDTTVLVWDMAAAARGLPAGIPAADGAALEALWADLAGADGLKAHRAVWSLAAAPARSLAFLKKRLRPVGEADVKAVAHLLADLNHAGARVRDAASRQLERLGERAAPALRRALAKPVSLEVRRRVELLLTKLDGPVRIPEDRRALRAVEAVEYMGTREARALLEALARGAPEARLTREARASLERLTRSVSAAP